MKKIEFRLDMPHRGSWNGGWSGEGRNYLIYKNISDKVFEKLDFGNQSSKSWYYRWDDGWGASIKARVMQQGERRNKSDGFCGYGWMVDNILCYGEIYFLSERGGD